MRLQMFLFIWIVSICSPSCYSYQVRLSVKCVHSKNPKDLMMIMAALTCSTKALPICTKTELWGLSAHFVPVLGSWGLISFPKKFTQTKLYYPPKDHKHISLCHLQFQAQLAEAVRLIHQPWNLPLYSLQSAWPSLQIHMWTKWYNEHLVPMCMMTRAGTQRLCFCEQHCKQVPTDEQQLNSMKWCVHVGDLTH